MIGNPLGEVLDLKQRAVAFRNRERFDKAIQALDDAVARLEAMRGQAADDPQLTALVRAELADAHGMKGGVLRRSGDLKGAWSEYRKGIETEGRESPNTYNLGNEIVLSLLTGQQGLSEADLQSRIALVLERLERQTGGERRDDWWAWADLAQFRLLRGDVNGAYEAFQRGRATGPRDVDVHRSLEVLGELARALQGPEDDRAQQILLFVERMLSPF